MDKLEKDIIKQCGGFCQICLEYPSTTNKLAVVYINGDIVNRSPNNTRVMCQTCQAKREGRPRPGITKKKLKQLTLFNA